MCFSFSPLRCGSLDLLDRDRLLREDEETAANGALEVRDGVLLALAREGIYPPVMSRLVADDLEIQIDVGAVVDVRFLLDGDAYVDGRPETLSELFGCAALDEAETLFPFRPAHHTNVRVVGVGLVHNMDAWGDLELDHRAGVP